MHCGTTHSRQKPVRRKSKFTREEDEQLSKLIARYGSSNWDLIASKMPNRNARQCRDRWYYSVSPDVSKEPWSQDEDQLLLWAYSKLGPKWVQISRCFRNRTDTHIKNRWLVLQRRFRKYGTIQSIEDIKRPIIQSLASLEKPPQEKPPQKKEEPVMDFFWDDEFSFLHDELSGELC